MTREHAPRPGATWETRLVANEVVVTAPEGPWGGSTRVTPWIVDGPQAVPPRPNRATRRATARAARKASR
ncbi:hypothetical protein [Kitasatospora sp. A2-31]|uniref:hypothetical protein n=1 Tax=Kitasatospora sp. A2-31 TaxID=2916414 RepID=UPI001EE948F5|nr:hypothetical protein [Kitasatospora sp. A2-31]MCG6493409.1 hypothetical protein [Kitasatospora sp. A2-31]